MAYGKINGAEVIPSRYSSISRAEVWDGEKVALIIGKRRTFITQTPSSVLLHVIQDGDNFQDLARKYYGDALLWFAIADNNTFVFFPEDITKHVGKTLTLLPLDVVRAL